MKKNTLYPIYNEALVFDVPADNIEDVSLIVKVIDYDRYEKIFQLCKIFEYESKFSFCANVII